MDTTGAFLVFRIERVEDAEHSFTAHGYEVILEIAPWMSLIHRDTSDAFAMRTLGLLRDACREAHVPGESPPTLSLAVDNGSDEPSPPRRR